ncbi:MAG: hypothetical protein KIT72_10025 [Polyangiaceae bacterium]|nr:hypothetical protein [Polyangiaceae bacterium]MCW5790747.1 hypothetical protein [Polyangiaceae bacterium]
MGEPPDAPDVGSAFELRSSRADRTPLPTAARVGVEPRVVDAWCAWLDALASDAEAALAAAMAYKALDAEGRERWLDVLEQDAPRVSVPRIAVYAPLLSVEADPVRRQRLLTAIGPAEAEASPRVALRCLWGEVGDGQRVVAIVSPLYLDFVQVLACAYDDRRGFSWVKHDPIVDDRMAPRGGHQIGGVRLEPTPLKPVVDELAYAIVAHQRSGRELPEALCIFADLFGQQPEPETLRG